MDHLLIERRCVQPVLLCSHTSTLTAVLYVLKVFPEPTNTLICEFTALVKSTLPYSTPFLSNMNPHLSASLQDVHNVIQTGIHRFHFKDGAFEDKIAQKQEPRDPSEVISTLELLIASSLTTISEKIEFRKMVDTMGMMGQMHSITTWYSEEDAKTFNIATDSLMVPFVEDHRKRSW